MDYEDTALELEQERTKYLSEVKRNKRYFPNINPLDPKYSEQRDVERQAARRGLGGFIAQGPTRETFEEAHKNQIDNIFKNTDIRHYKGIPRPEQEALEDLPAFGVGSMLLQGAKAGLEGVGSLAQKIMPTSESKLDTGIAIIGAIPGVGSIGKLGKAAKLLKGEQLAVSAVGQAKKDATKQLLLHHLELGIIPEGSAFRGTSMAELQSIAKTKQLQIGADAEGRTGISASHITKDGFPVYGEGVGIIAKKGQHTESGRFGESLIDPNLHPDKFEYVVNGNVLSFKQLQDHFKVK